MLPGSKIMPETLKAMLLQSTLSSSKVEEFKIITYEGEYPDQIRSFPFPTAMP